MLDASVSPGPSRWWGSPLRGCVPPYGLVGLNFDSNWEAVSASWMYDPRYKRAIHVDLRYLRYLRWLMAKVYPSPHLLREMGKPCRRNP